MESPIQNLYSRDEVKAMIEMAAIAGAKKALEDIGLHDEDAGKDVEEIRSLLEAWRSAKKTAWDTTVKFITAAFLAALAFGVYMKTKT